MSLSTWGIFSRELKALKRECLGILSPPLPHTHPYPSSHPVHAKQAVFGNKSLVILGECRNSISKIIAPGAQWVKLSPAGPISHIEVLVCSPIAPFLVLDP